MPINSRCRLAVNYTSCLRENFLRKHNAAVLVKSN